MTKPLVGRKQDHKDDTPFLPTFVNEHAKPNDYVILKMDLDEQGRFDHLAYLASTDNVVDELVWEHQAKSMYLLEEMRSLTSDLTLRQLYDLFLLLRQKGIRAHAWV